MHGSRPDPSCFDEGGELPAIPDPIQREAERIARMEELRGGYEDSIIRRESRRTALELLGRESQVVEEEISAARESEDVDAWVHVEAAAMLRAGWSHEQLAEFGFSAEIVEAARRRHGGG